MFGEDLKLKVKFTKCEGTWGCFVWDMLWQLSETDPVPVFFLINVASDGLWGKTWSVIKQMGEMGHLILSSKYFTFISLIEKALYKIAFHGRSKHIWESLMTIQEVFYQCHHTHDQHGHDHHHHHCHPHPDHYDYVNMITIHQCFWQKIDRTQCTKKWLLAFWDEFFNFTYSTHFPQENSSSNCRFSMVYTLYIQCTIYKKSWEFQSLDHKL